MRIDLRKHRAIDLANVLALDLERGDRVLLVIEGEQPKRRQRTKYTPRCAARGCRRHLKDGQAAVCSKECFRTRFAQILEDMAVLLKISVEADRR